MTLNNLSTFYDSLELKFNIKNSNLTNATYTNVDSNFAKSVNYPKHRWYNYKEGFSPILVESIFQEFELTNTSMVMDPFCGAGTTLTVAKKRNISSIGFEVNKFAYFISKIKTTDYSDFDIKQYKIYLEKLHKINFSFKRKEFPDEYVSRMFEKEMFSVQLNIREYIFSLENCNAKYLLLFTWLCILEQCSLFRKAGNGLKKRSQKININIDNPSEYVINLMEKLSISIINDCEKEREINSDAKSIIYNKSAFFIEDTILPDSLDLVLFSPPYANCFDYTKIYYMELWMGGFINSRQDQKNIRMDSIRSHCHATWPARYENFYLKELNEDLLPLLRCQKLWTNRIPDMLNGYFADMEEVLRQIRKSLKSNGKCVIVVSNSAYAGIIIPTDLLLALIAVKNGYKVIEIEVKRLIITSSQQYKRTENFKKYLRESVIKLEKNNEYSENR